MIRQGTLVWRLVTIPLDSAEPQVPGPGNSTILHAMMDDAPPPYTDGELAAIAEHCNEADKALRKIERRMQKRVAAVAMSGHVGEVFKAVVTG